LFRVLQGAFGGGLQPMAQAILKDTFPPPRLGAMPQRKELAVNIAMYNKESKSVEKRISPRAKVSRMLRVRPSDPDLEHFEELPISVNVSKRGIYFHTHRQDYHMGMRLNCGRETNFHMRLFLKRIQTQFRVNSGLVVGQAKADRAEHRPIGTEP
jgi:hypothetical protein